ncbi:unnamed protein product [marine sediment metagenome]|uniref:Uncharacterized protein n=1 Tax=marine sediment metagenome TaxID=412755 RepID=X1KZX8_9ZZZZ
MTVFLALVLSFSLLLIPASNPSFDFVVAAPDDNYGETTLRYVDLLGVLGETPWSISFDNTGQTGYASTGAVLACIRVGVRLDNAYAENSDDAWENTRVHVLLKDPSAVTKFDNYLSPSFLVQVDNYWALTYSSEDLSLKLVTGLYTVTTTYDIFAIPV